MHEAIDAGHNEGRILEVLERLKEIVVEDEVVLVVHRVGVEVRLLGNDAVGGWLRVGSNGFLKVRLNALAEIELIREVESLVLNHVFDHVHEGLCLLRTTEDII